MTFIERQTLAAELLALKPGEEKIVGTEVWFRIDPHEFKVSTVGLDADTYASWVRAITRDVVDAL